MSPKLILVPHHRHFMFKNYNIFMGHNSEAKLNWCTGNCHWNNLWCKTLFRTGDPCTCMKKLFHSLCWLSLENVLC